MANNGKITIKLDGEKEYNAAIKRINTNTRALNSEMELMKQKFGEDEKSSEALKKELEILTRQIENQKAKVEETNKVYEEAKNKLGETDSKTLRFKTSLNKAETELEKLKKRQDEYSKALKNMPIEEAGKKIDEWSGKFTAAGGKVTALGKTLSSALTVPIAGAGVAAAKLGMDFEASYAKATTLMDSSSADIEGIKEKMLEVSSEMNINNSELNEGFYEALSSGVQATEDGSSAIDFLVENAKLATAGFTEFGSAIDTTTSVLNAYQMKQEEVSRVANILINTQNEGKITVDQLSSTLSRVTPIAASVGMSFEQVGASFATITAIGTRAEESSTQIAALLRSLSDVNGETGQLFEKLSGGSFEEYLAQGNTLGEALQLLADYAQETGVKINNLFSESTAGEAALALSQNADKFNQSLETMNKNTTAVDEAFQKMSDTDSYRLTSAINELNNAFTEMGTALSPVINLVADNISALAEWFGGLSEETQKSIVLFAGFAAALGPVTQTIGTFISTSGNMLKVFKNELSAGTVIAKEFAEALQAGFSAAEAFEYAGLTSLISGSAVAMTAYAAAAAAFAIAIGKAIANHKELSSNLRQAKQNYENTQKSIEDTIQETEKNSAAARELTKELEKLQTKTNLTSEEQERMSGIVEQLNKLYPDLNLTIDENTGKLEKNTQEIYNNIDAYEQKVKKQAALDKYTESIRAEEEARQNKIAAEDDLLNTAKKHETVGLNDPFSAAYSAVDMTAATWNLKKANDQYEQAVEDKKQFLNQLKGLDNELNTQTKKSVEKVKTYAGEEASIITQSLQSKVGTVGELSESAKEIFDKTDYLHDVGIISDKDYYEQLARLRNKYFAENSEGWREYSIKVYQGLQSVNEEAAKAAEEAVQEQQKKQEEAAKAAEEAEKARQEALEKARSEELEILKWNLDMGMIAEESYYKALAEYRNKYFDESTSEWRSYTLEIEKYRKEQLKKTYQEQREQSFEWIDEHNARQDWGKTGTTAQESYARVAERDKRAIAEGIIDEDEYKSAVDDIVDRKVQDFKDKLEFSKDWISLREFYDDWDDFGTNEAQSWQRVMEAVEQGYKEGLLSYKTYTNEIKSISKDMYTAVKGDNEGIAESAESYLDKILNSKKTEIDAQIKALNDEVSQFKAEQDKEERNKQLSELQAEAALYRNAGTMQGQEHYKELTEQIEGLNKEAQLEELEEQNNKIIENLNAEYEQFEQRKQEILEKLNESLGLATNKLTELGENVKAAISGALETATGAAKIQSSQKVINNNYTNTNNLTQNNNVNDRIDLIAALKSFTNTQN